MCSKRNLKPRIDAAADPFGDHLRMETSCIVSKKIGAAFDLSDASRFELLAGIVLSLFS